MHNESFFNKNDNSSYLILKRLELCNNNISVIYYQHFIKLIELEIVFIHNNLINIIGLKTFKYNTKLKELDLAKNRITVFDFDIVQLQSLEGLDLSFNPLTALDEYAFYSVFNRNRSKVDIHLDCNAFRCTCEFNWIYKPKYGDGMLIMRNTNNDTCSKVKSGILRRTAREVELRSHLSDICSTAGDMMCVNGSCCLFVNYISTIYIYKYIYNYIIFNVIFITIHL